MTRSWVKAGVAVLALMTTVTPVFAQTMAPMTPELPAPRNIAYPGVLDIHVDATDLDHRIFTVTETVPVDAKGDFVLLLPKWLPGHHSPTPHLGKIAGIKVTTPEGRVLEWRRDPVEMTALHIDVPAGVKTLKVEFKYLSPTTTEAGRVVMTSEMLNLQWVFSALYPDGYYVSRIPVRASVKLPEGWQYGTALETESVAEGNVVTFKTTTFETLMDSPIFAGKYYKMFDLNPEGSVPVRMHVVADRPELLNATDDALVIHRRLVQQAFRLYGGYHFDHYDFLVAASEKLGRIGLEHHRSSENRVALTYLTDWKTKFVGRDLLAHEMTHSWNGKFRRPDDLWSPAYYVPQRGSGLWVYEGQTQYWGIVLAARSGLYTPEQAIDYIGLAAATYNNLPARDWRYLEDTTNDPVISSRAPQNWRSYQRSEDYYVEGLLIWLDADTLIRNGTNGAKSLDDFAKAFFGAGGSGTYTPMTYDFNEVVRTLNSVYAYDWAGFLNERLYKTGGGAPLDGLARAGYRLTYSETPSAYYKTAESDSKTTNLTYSLGVVIDKDAKLTSVLWDSPAFDVGLAPGMQIVALNGKAFDADRLKAAITDAKTTKAPLVFLIKAEENYLTVTIPYFDGLRYPVLERIEGQPDLLSPILAEKP